MTWLRRTIVAVRIVLGFILLLGVCYATVTAAFAIVWALVTGRI